MTWWFEFNLSPNVTALLVALATALALRAALVARRNGRRPLFYTLLGAVVTAFGAVLGTVGTQLPPLSPAFASVALAACGVLFVLGVERVRLEEIPTPSKQELEALLSEGLRSYRLRLNDAEYELARDYIRVKRAHVGRELTPPELRLLAALAQHNGKK
jgi:hypothetical protein